MGHRRMGTDLGAGGRQEEPADSGEGLGGGQETASRRCLHPGGSPLSCLHPILSPKDHLPGLGRNHGNRKPKETTEILGGHSAARGHASDFGETGSFSNKGRGDKRASADGSNNRIRPLWDEQAGCGCGQAADGNQLCLGLQCPARELRER